MISNETIALERKWKDRNWCKEVLTPYQYRFLELTIPVIRQLFGDNWDIELNFEYEPSRTLTNSFGFNYQEPGRQKLNTLSYIIHFPQFTITNSLEQSHVIRDLYVRSTFIVKSDVSFELQHLRGLRATISTKEYIGGYSHSHLGTKDFNSESSRGAFKKFCLGSGTGIANTQTMLNNQLLEQSIAIPNYNIDPNMFKLYMMQIKTYINWESLEGVPYLTIGNLAQKNEVYEYSSIFDTSNLRESEALYRRFYSPENLPPINWKLENNKYIIIDDEIFASGFIPGSSAIESHFFYKDNTGMYYTEGNLVDAQALRTSTPLFIYKGEYTHFNVIITPGESEIEKPLYIHSKVLDYVKQQLEQLANKAALIRSYNK
jgi:hypothetical protein